MRKRYVSKSRKKSKRKVKSKRISRTKIKYNRCSNNRDGMLIYNGGIEPFDDKNESTSNTFRKYLKKDSKGNLTKQGQNELAIVTKLKELYDRDWNKIADDKYNENLIIIKNIGRDDIGEYYDTDIVNTYVNLMKKEDEDNIKNILNQLTKLTNTRRYLQNNFIAYIDWKLDNIGLDKSGNIILFDFDCSGIFESLLSENWKVKPVDSTNYKYAVNIFNAYSCKNKCINMDTFLFRNMLFNTLNMSDLPR